jgi:DNA adenine methylase
MNSFIPWIGGKSQLRKPILASFPKDVPERYIEPFGGAAWILLSRDRHAPMEVFNDLDGQLINLYRCIRHHCSELQNELRRDDLTWIPNSRELFFDFKEQINMRGLTDIQRAARYFYIIRTSFGADRRTFACTARQATANAIDRLPEIQERLKNVVIENRDFEALIKTYDRTTALYYIDPPYYMAEECYEGFNLEDHIRLRGILDKLKGRFLLSYNDLPYIREIYSGFNIQGVTRGNSLVSKQGGVTPEYKEVIIANYTLPNV